MYTQYIGGDGQTIKKEDTKNANNNVPRITCETHTPVGVVGVGELMLMTRC